MELRPLDPSFPIARQLSVDTGPIVLLNLFLLEPEDEQSFLEAWKRDAAFMRRQPGYISTQLHRGIGKGCAYLNYAVWESTEQFRAAFGNPEFQAKLDGYPSSAIASPHLFRKMAIPGICVA